MSEVSEGRPKVAARRVTSSQGNRGAQAPQEDSRSIPLVSAHPTLDFFARNDHENSKGPRGSIFDLSLFYETVAYHVRIVILARESLAWNISHVKLKV